MWTFPIWLGIVLTMFVDRIQIGYLRDAGIPYMARIMLLKHFQARLWFLRVWKFPIKKTDNAVNLGLYGCQSCQIIEMSCLMTKPTKECAPSADSDQPGHQPCLIRVFAVRMKKPWILSYPLSAQWGLWSDWVNAQADLSLRWAHTHFVGFVMMRLKYW